MRRYRFLLGLFFLPGVLMAGVYTVTNSDSSGSGSLAQAVNDANSAPGPHQIVFAIPGPGVHKIDLSAGGVTLGSSITIDGYSQPGASANTLSVGDNAVILIQLDGGGPFASQSAGVTINGDNCVVRGLSFTGFSSTIGAGAIFIGPSSEGGNGNRIEGNFIGLSPDGVTLNGNDLGVFFVSTTITQNVIGGNVPAARNIISGNRTGVFIQNDSTIAGNYFGTDASGLGQGYGNDRAILVSSNNLIGTGEPGGGNVITGSQTGIYAVGPNTIRGNLIGPYADGSPSFGNVYGIFIPSIFGESAIGGMDPGEGNVIAFNYIGVAIGAVSGAPNGGARILSNLFYGNIQKDVDLSGGGLAVNDFLDQDSGPNGQQNFPIVVSVARNPGETVVSGGLNSKPSTAFTLQFFASGPASNPTQTLLGTQTLTTNSAGDAPFQFTFPTTTSSEEFITATATDPQGNTSEFFPANGKVDLANISTRGNVSAGDNALIGGFILNTGYARAFLIRALGPSLNINSALSNPRIELIASNGVIVGSNDNWRDSQSLEIAATGLAPANDQEAALIVHAGSLSEANYTALVTGADGGSGVATVEVYALGVDPTGWSQKFLNIATRGYVGTGDSALIGGTILQGNAVQKLIVRALGPDLAGAGVANPLQDPTLELRDAEGALLATNDDWRSDQEQEIIASGLAPQDDRDSAILTSLLPTSYTAIVRGKNNTTGVALVEIYKLD